MEDILKYIYILKGTNIKDSDIQECLDMEAEIFKEDECQDFELCHQIHELNPYTDLFFKDIRTGKIIGNIDVCPITDECYELMRSGKLMDSDMTIDMVVPYKEPGMYNIYFTGIALREEYRNKGLSSYMIKKTFEHFEELARKGFKVRRVIADVVSDNGEHLCEKLNMNKICDTEHGTQIYELIL